jgi:hypothetical protein
MSGVKRSWGTCSLGDDGSDAGDDDVHAEAAAREEAEEDAMYRDLFEDTQLVGSGQMPVGSSGRSSTDGAVVSVLSGVVGVQSLAVAGAAALQMLGKTPDKSIRRAAAVGSVRGGAVVEEGDGGSDDESSAEGAPAAPSCIICQKSSTTEV